MFNRSIQIRFIKIIDYKESIIEIKDRFISMLQMIDM